MKAHRGIVELDCMYKGSEDDNETALVKRGLSSWAVCIEY